MPKAEWHQREMRRLYRALREGSFDLELGWTDADVRGKFTPTRRGRIRINPFLFVIDTLIHELYHYLDPRAGEQAVRDQEHAVFWEMTTAQRRTMFQHLQRRWLETMARYRARGRRVSPCPFCGQELPHHDVSDE